MTNRTSILVSKTLYQVAMATLVGVVVWVGFSVYQALSVVPEVEIEQRLLESINPDLDLALLDEITTRAQLAKEVDELFLAVPTPSPSSKPIIR